MECCQAQIPKGENEFDTERCEVCNSVCCSECWEALQTGDGWVYLCHDCECTEKYGITECANKCFVDYTDHGVDPIEWDCPLCGVTYCPYCSDESFLDGVFVCNKCYDNTPESESDEDAEEKKKTSEEPPTKKRKVA